MPVLRFAGSLVAQAGRTNIKSVSKASRESRDATSLFKLHELLALVFAIFWFEKIAQFPEQGMLFFCPALVRLVDFGIAVIRRLFDAIFGTAACCTLIRRLWPLLILVDY